MVRHPGRIELHAVGRVDPSTNARLLQESIQKPFDGQAREDSYDRALWKVAPGSESYRYCCPSLVSSQYNLPSSASFTSYAS